MTEVDRDRVSRDNRYPLHLDVMYSTQPLHLRPLVRTPQEELVNGHPAPPFLPSQSLPLFCFHSQSSNLLSSQVLSLPFRYWSSVCKRLSEPNVDRSCSSAGRYSYSQVVSMSMVDTCHTISFSTHIMYGMLVIRVVAVVLPVP